MKKFILLSASLLSLGSAITNQVIQAQIVPDVASSGQVNQISPLDQLVTNALNSYQSNYPNSQVSAISIHKHQENGQFIIRIIGSDGSQRQQLIHYNNQDHFAQQNNTNPNTPALPLEQMLSISEISQRAMTELNVTSFVNMNIKADDDNDDRLEWEIQVNRDGQLIEIEMDAITGEITEVDGEDSLDDDYFYEAFYSYSNDDDDDDYDDDYYDDDYDDDDDDYYDDYDDDDDDDDDYYDDFDDDYYDDDYDDDDYDYDYDDDYDDDDDD